MRFYLPRFNRASIRLALTYLAIIMVLSVGFSIVLYKTSTGKLNIRLQPTANGKTGKVARPAQAYIDINGSSSGSTEISDLNAQLQKKVADIRTDLVHKLIILNVGALAVGGVFSYYLARRTLKPIETAMNAQERFASDASHELRTPLTVMQAEIEVVLHKPKLSLARAKAALRSNYQEVTKLRQLSEGLLRLAQPKQNNADYTVVVIDEVITAATNQVLKLAQAKHISITHTAPKLATWGDKQSLVQTIVILLDNAIKYSAPKSAISIEGRAEGSHIFLSIRDRGPGISAVDLPHIFERFYRTDTSRSKLTVSGYGLGLSIAQKIIQQHQGSIEVTSVLGQGSVFTIRLPRKIS
jgi:signal transduction histidine kinase